MEGMDTGPDVSVEEGRQPVIKLIDLSGVAAPVSAAVTSSRVRSTSLLEMEEAGLVIEQQILTPQVDVYRQAAEAKEGTGACRSAKEKEGGGAVDSLADLVTLANIACSQPYEEARQPTKVGQPFCQALSA